LTIERDGVFSPAIAGSPRECDDKFVSDVVRWMSDDHIVFETDYSASRHRSTRTRRSTFSRSHRRSSPTNRQAQGPVGQRGGSLPLSPEAICLHDSPASGGRLRRVDARIPRRRPNTSKTAWLASPDEIERVTARTTAARASSAARVPFFEKRWGEADFDPGSIATLDDLLAGAGLHGRRHPGEHRSRPALGDYQGVVATRRTPASRCVCTCRSGTTGTSRPTLYRSGTVTSCALLTARALYMQGIRSG